MHSTHQRSILKHIVAIFLNQYKKNVHDCLTINCNYFVTISKDFKNRDLGLMYSLGILMIK